MTRYANRVSTVLLQYAKNGGAYVVLVFNDSADAEQYRDAVKSLLEKEVEPGTTHKGVDEAVGEGGT